MTIMGLDHVQLAMPAGEENVARAFYAGLLSMEEVVKPEGLRSRGGCWFRSPGAAVHLGIADPFIAAMKAHPAFLVSDLQKLALILEAGGAPVTWDDALPDVRRFFTADPFGNRIEMIAAADEGLTHMMPAAS